MSDTTLYQFIYELQDHHNLSKHEQLVTGIINAIEKKQLERGDKLPSINEMVSEVGYARKTIVKAYEELKYRGLVESKKLKGYYVASEKTSQVLKVAVILYAFHTFQEDFYNQFREGLSDNIQLDVFFHHNNEELLETILLNTAKKYGMYVVAPIESDKIATRLAQLPPDKLLVVDRHLNLGVPFSFITQEFEQTTYQQLTALLPKIQKYQQVTLYFREDADYPEGIRAGFLTFLRTHNIQGIVQPQYKRGSLHENGLHIFIGDSELFLFLKDCAERGIRLGKEIGVVAHNDHVVKELLAGGITTISVDFKHMGSLAAQFVTQRIPIQQVLQSHLVDRHSL